jgi:hypothetical protein
MRFLIFGFFFLFFSHLVDVVLFFFFFFFKAKRLEDLHVERFRGKAKAMH